MEPLLKENKYKKHMVNQGCCLYAALENILFDIHCRGVLVESLGPFWSGNRHCRLLNMLATIDSPTEGEIYMNDTSIHDMKGADLTDFRRENLGFIFQDYNLLDSLTVKENILLPLAIAENSSERNYCIGEIVWLLKYLGLKIYYLNIHTKSPVGKSKEQLQPERL